MGGAVYYISPPQSLGEFFSDPIHGLTYIAFVLVSTAVTNGDWNTTMESVSLYGCLTGCWCSVLS